MGYRLDWGKIYSRRLGDLSRLKSKDVPVASPAAKCPKRRKFVGDLAALWGKGFSLWGGQKVFVIVLLSWGGSQMGLEICSGMGFNRGTPHSLGKLIEWKLGVIPWANFGKPTPHSLGKLIEWKQRRSALLTIVLSYPTRWGN